MFPKTPEFHLFNGLAFLEGLEHIPPDLPMGLEEIRRWAKESGLVPDSNQILTPRKIEAVSHVCSPEDKLLIGLEVSDASGSLLYFERPYLPVRSMIRRADVIVLNWWKVESTSVKFHFRLAQCGEEFCSESNAARVIPKFVEMLDHLASTYRVYPCADGSRAIGVSDHVRATFRKDGHSFDVDLVHESVS